MAKRSDDSEEVAGRSFIGKFITFVVLIILLTSIAIVLFFRFCSEYVGPGEFGIKQVRIGFLVFEKGIQHEVVESGYRLQLPYIHKIHILPRQLQVLEFTDNPPPPSKHRHYEKAAHIQTDDGYYVRVDLSIIYKITNPYLVLTTLGPADSYIQRGIVPEAEPALKDTLGGLTTEEFYNSHRRVQQSEATKNKLNETLREKGIEVDAVLIRYFHYSPQIQKNIEEKKLKDQLVFKNQAEARAAAEEANLKKIIEEGKAAVKVKLEEGRAYIVEKRAGKERYQRERVAQADLLVKLAEAEKTKKVNAAYAGEGARRLVGLKMAEVLDGIKIIIIPSDGQQGFNPLDLDQTLNLFEVSQ